MQYRVEAKRCFVVQGICAEPSPEVIPRIASLDVRY